MESGKFILALFTATDVAAWTGAILAILVALGTIGTAAIALYAKLGSQAAEAAAQIAQAKADANASRITAQSDRLNVHAEQIGQVQMAMPPVVVANIPVAGVSQSQPIPVADRTAHFNPLARPGGGSGQLPEGTKP